MIPILTIDGPGGVGKGTVARRIAQQQGWHLLDSGAIYRAFALLVLTNKIAIDNTNKLQQIAQTFDLRFEVINNKEASNVYLNGTEVSADLRTETVADMASKLGAIKVIRNALLKKQQDFASPPGLVADGRDMGSVVFVNAAYKVFLDASKEQRAKRRLKQLQAQGINGIITEVLAQIQARDRRDLHRLHSPLVAAENALVIDTTTLSIDEVVAKVATLMKV